MSDELYAQDLERTGRAVLFEKGSNGLLWGLVGLAALGLFFGWGPMRGLHERWIGKSERPAVTDAERGWRASRHEAERKAKAAAERAEQDERGTLTLGNFEAKFRDHLKRADYTLSRTNCVADSFNRGGTQCTYQFNIDMNGAILFIKSGPSSRRLTYVGLMIGNPELMQEPARSEMRRFYDLVAAHLVGVTDPNLGPEARNALLTKLRAGVGATHNEASIIIGEWAYIAGSGILDWSFAAERR
jgi:hypothetical protein